MAPHVEASSLSDITQLAANPPRYPRNPTERKRQPLTLYLARVPGSKDIILTTLKPQLKNVTAEDVAASLYYLHLNTEDDLRFLQETDGSATITEEPEPLPQKPLPRKPLSESSRPSAELNRNTESSAAAIFSTSIPRRKPLTAEASTIDHRQEQLESERTFPRRPLGPRPLGSEITATRNVLPGVENFRPNSASRHLQPVPVLKSRSEGGEDLNSAESMTDGMNLKGFSITLIRRDPSSGAQWNVGIISGQPALEEAQTRRSKSSKKQYFDISVNLTTPGYSQFRNNQTIDHITDSVTDSLSPIRANHIADISPVQQRHDSGFSRQVRMEGSSFWGRPSMHKRASSDISGEHVTARGRDLSGDSIFDGLDVSSSNDGTSASTSSSHSKGYIFSSPWGGVCKFSTGSGGRSLRCKHNLPSPISASQGSGFIPAPQPAAIVSELRFNLPSSTVFSSSSASEATAKRPTVDSGRFRVPKFGHIRNKISSDKTRSPQRPPLPPRPHPTSYAAMYPSDEEGPPPVLPPRSPASSFLKPINKEAASFVRSDTSQFEGDLSNSDNADDDDRLDLSIGQEKAGGGNRGKRAKLGKLIIHDEGFKMLDLAVAANLGIWWSVWESDNR
ncbi:hypothetical protein EG329_007126 [Mollisiaceae sp. DMI_Dod_QoI]|nr:hypothetical protein EG329_007126 [Helotiales sp. DMI_Dod_QoI]